MEDGDYDDDQEEGPQDRALGAFEGSYLNELGVG